MLTEISGDLACHIRSPLHHRKVLVLLCVALGAFLATVEARRGGFTIPTFGPITVKPISCDSVLVKLNPSAYPHCCSPGPWRFDRTENVATSVCPSGRRYVLVRTTCPGMAASEGINRTICKLIIFRILCIQMFVYVICTPQHIH